MFKKLLAVCLLVLVFSVPAFAQTTTPYSGFLEAMNVTGDIVNTLSPTGGIMWGIREHQVKAITSFQVVGYQSAKYQFIKLNGNFLYAPSNLLGGSLTYPIGSLSQITGLNVPVPVLNWFTNANINVGYGLGWFTSNVDSRSNDDGPVLTGNIKF